MMEWKPVRKCVCFDVPFSAILEEGVRSIEEAQEKFGCGTKCGTCIPYVQRTIETGETSFDIIDEMTAS